MSLQGLLFFPVTPFDYSGAVDIARLEQHIRKGITDGAGAVFAACGTGEFHALSATEVIDVAAAAVRAAEGRVPVFVGVGGTLGSALEMTAGAERVGAQGILLLPPYLVAGSQEGLINYAKSIASSTSSSVIVYQRGLMTFEPESLLELASIPNIIGLKDGVGDLTKMQILVSRVKLAGYDEFLFFNGLPTAELSMRAYRALGVHRYSSAVFAFAPEIALAFHRALAEEDDETTEMLLRQFYLPFVDIRDRQPGYPVALVKAAAEVNGESLGGVRAPLVDPTQADLNDLHALLDSARAAFLVAVSPVFR